MERQTESAWKVLWRAEAAEHCGRGHCWARFGLRQDGRTELCYGLQDLTWSCNNAVGNVLSLLLVTGPRLSQASRVSSLAQRRDMSFPKSSVTDRQKTFHANSPASGTLGGHARTRLLMSDSNSKYTAKGLHELLSRFELAVPRIEQAVLFGPRNVASTSGHPPHFSPDGSSTARIIPPPFPASIPLSPSFITTLFRSFKTACLRKTPHHP